MKVRSVGWRPLVSVAAATVLFSATTASPVPDAAAQDVERIYVSYEGDFPALDEDLSFTVQVGGVTVTDEDFRASRATLAVQLVAMAPDSRVVETCPGKKAGAVVKLEGISADAAISATLSFTTQTGAQGYVVTDGRWPVGLETVRIALCKKLKL